MKQKIKLIVIGAGNRGYTYSEYVKQDFDDVEIVAVAEPRKDYANRFAASFSVPSEQIYTDWLALVEEPKFADAVIITVPDLLHKDVAIAFAKKGYHILLEKPMAITESDCIAIADAAAKYNIILCVCHVLRYTKYTKTLKALIDNGTIGDIVTIQHLEPVGYSHQAHSYVRGNWKNERESGFMLLTKSCHDIDWLRFIMGKRIKAVSSFGNLKHFRKDNKPQNSAYRCMDCEVESDCAYSAKKIYLQKAQNGIFTWPVDVLTSETSIDSVKLALQKGPYGICVYECENDVVDHQVVNILFENDSTATFTMTAFSMLADRQTRIFGTKGEIFGKGNVIEHSDFLTGKKTSIQMSDISDGTILSGHGGGDYELIKTFIAAVSANDPTKLLSGPSETLETHLAVFAAEKARVSGSVINLEY